ncbi:MAG: SlyX family protein [Alphaproteobacteria bacterium]|nr:SlyX family protein [Alphaproteobacteria bacterium]
MKNIQNQLTDLEIYVANQEKIIEEMNDELVRLSKIVETLVAQNKLLFEALKETPVKPLSEETRPPHY